MNDSPPTPSPPSRIDELLQIAFGSAFWLAGLGIVFFQMYSFLQNGEWLPVSLIDLAAFFLDGSWLLTPKEWLGLHWLLDKVPASLTACVIGYFILIADDL